MQIIGVILKGDTASFTKEQWISCVEREPALMPYESVRVRNPATGKLVWAKPPASSRKLLIDGSQIGTFSWSQNETPLVWVESEPDRIPETAAFASQIAQKLGGQFTTETPD